MHNVVYVNRSVNVWVSCVFREIMEFRTLTVTYMLLQDNMADYLASFPIRIPEVN